MNPVSNILKNRRKELGLTLSQIADKMGVSEATVQRWESGNIKSLRQERIGPLSEILRVSPAVLMGLADEDIDHSLPLSGPASITSKEEELLTLHRQLNEEGQEKLLSYADGLVSSGKYIKKVTHLAWWRSRSKKR